MFIVFEDLCSWYCNVGAICLEEFVKGKDLEIGVQSSLMAISRIHCRSSQLLM